MGIDQIKGIGPATLKKLDAAGVRTLSDMRSMDTDQVAKRTGIQKRRLDEWRLEARVMKVLDDVKGIGPSTKKRLKQAGIHSLEDLAKASAKQVAHQTRVAHERARKWQTEARGLLQKTQGRMAEEGASLQRKGTRAAKQARKRASEAAKKGREAAQDLGAQLRERMEQEPQNGGHERATAPSRTASQDALGDGEASAGFDPATRSNGDGDSSGFLTRLRRLFQPRT